MMTVSTEISHPRPISDRLIQTLVCPQCWQPVHLSAGDPVNGQLRCVDGHRYPVIRGIPRMFVGELPDELVQFHRDYFLANPELLNRNRQEKDQYASIKARTSHAFGYEWTQFPDYSADNYERMIGPAMAHRLTGERVLEVGCGAGRHALRSAARGGEIYALDYSLAVEAAADNARDVDNVHVIQGDVYNLPFRSGTFDCAYSLGVLHHLPQPEDGFREMAQRVRIGGRVFLWVYKKTLRKILFEPIRRPFTYLPARALKQVAWAAAVIDYGVLCNLYRLVSRWGGIDTAVRVLTPNRIREYAGYDFSVSYTDWYDRLSAPIVRVYSESDIRGWFERAGLADVVVSSQADFGVRGYGRIEQHNS